MRSLLLDLHRKHILKRWRMLLLYNGRLAGSLLRNQLSASHLIKSCNPPLPFGRLFNTSSVKVNQHCVIKNPPLSSPILRRASFSPILSKTSVARTSTNSYRRGLSTLAADHPEINHAYTSKDENPVKTKDATASSEEQATRPIVAYHLFFCAALVYLIIVVGGLTRLTESGLSITEWNPGFKGMKLPWSDAEWNAEWDKYRGTPEWAV